MSTIMNIWGNFESYLAIFGTFVTFVTAVAVVTPTKKDDKIVSVLDKIGRWADRFGIQFKKPL